MRLDSTAANEKAAQIGETWAASFASEPAPRWRKRVFYLVDAPRVVKNRVARRPITVTHDAPTR